MSLKVVVRPIDLPPGRRVLVISDIHGNLPLLKGVLRKAGFGGEDILIILGDILERNAGSLDTLRYVMELSRRYTVHTLLGNCDNIIPAFVDQRYVFSDEFYHKRWFGRLGEKSVLVKMAHLAGVPIESPADYPAAQGGHRPGIPARAGFFAGAAPHLCERRLSLCSRRCSPGGGLGGAGRL